MFCIEMKPGNDPWERLRGKYRNERAAQKAVAAKIEADKQGKGKKREYRIVPFEERWE